LNIGLNVTAQAVLLSVYIYIMYTHILSLNLRLRSLLPQFFTILKHFVLE